MAPINETPFLKFLIDYLISQEIKEFIFALGYESKIIETWLKKDFPSLTYKVSLETEPLGTGGAIKKAMKLIKGNVALVTNGDTLFKANVNNELMKLHLLSDSNCTLSLKPITEFERYGVVEIDSKSRIIEFKEKKYYKKGCINGGMYLIQADELSKVILSEKFSFEKDYLQAYYKKRNLFGSIQDEYFIDIGVPEDYLRAQDELK